MMQQKICILSKWSHENNFAHKGNYLYFPRASPFFSLSRCCLKIQSGNTLLSKISKLTFLSNSHMCAHIVKTTKHIRKCDILSLPCFVCQNSSLRLMSLLCVLWLHTDMPIGIFEIDAKKWMTIIALNPTLNNWKNSLSNDMTRKQNSESKRKVLMSF